MLPIDINNKYRALYNVRIDDKIFEVLTLPLLLRLQVETGYNPTASIIF